MDHYERAGLVFDVRDTGPETGGDVGVPVVCLHGFPQDASAFDAVSQRLVDGGCRVLAPTQRGYSPGARPAGRSSYVVSELVTDVTALLDAAGLASAHVVGHDWGGVVAWALAATQQPRVRSLTVLSTPHPAAMRQGVVAGTQALRSAYMGAFQLPYLPEAVLLAGGGFVLGQLLRRSGLPADHAERYVAAMREPGALSAALGWYRALLVPAPGETSIGQVRVPTSFLVGEHDPFFAAASVAATGAQVDASFELRELPAGHWLPETQPEAVATAVLGHVERERLASR